MYICMYVCMHVCMYACLYVCVFVSMYASMYLFIYIYVCISIYVYLSMYETWSTATEHNAHLFPAETWENRPIWNCCCLSSKWWSRWCCPCDGYIGTIGRPNHQVAATATSRRKDQQCIPCWLCQWDCLGCGHIQPTSVSVGTVPLSR